MSDKIKAQFNFVEREPIKAVFKMSPINSDYNGLSNKPQINGVTLIGNKTSSDLGINIWGGITGTLSDQTDLQNALNTKLSATVTNPVEGQVIKYDGTNWINSTATAVAEWGTIIGTLSNQTDLQTALSAKQDTISDLATIRSNAENGNSAYGTIQTYGDIVTHNFSEVATAAQGALADTSIQPNDNISELNNDAGYITKAVNNLDNYMLTTDINSALSEKQPNLTSANAGTGISITGSGSSVVISNTQTSAEWGNITGTLSNQTDLQEALDAKQDTLTSANAGDNVTITTGGTTHDLPAEYQEIQYVQATGAQYLDTGVVLSSNYKYEIEFMPITPAGDIIGNQTDYTMLYREGNRINLRYVGGAQYLNWSASIKKKVVYSHNNGNDSFSLTGFDDMSWTSTEVTHTATVKLFANTGYIPSDNGSGNIYYCKIWNDNVLVREMYPCYRKSDNKPGMYDIVNSVFYVSESDNFIAGEGIAENLKINALSGLTATVTELNYTDGVTSNIQTQLNSKLNTSDIINNVTTTTTNQALSANMGKELNDRINNVSARGRFLSEWNCTTGLAETTPTTLPYEYKTGDYFIVGTVGSTNYQPTGSSYTGTASTTVETGTVAVNDTYLYDGTVWKLLHGADVSVTFASIAGQPTDNTNLASALNAKQDTLTSGTGISLLNNSVSINQVATEGYNINITGSLTTLNGVISGFSSTDYATVPVQFSPRDDSWEIVYKFTTASSKPSRYRYLLGSLQGSNSIVIGQYSTGVLTYWLSSQGGSTWDICSDQRGTIVLSDNTAYTVSVAYDGHSIYTMSISTDDGTSWTQDTTLTSSNNIYGGTIYLGSPYDQSDDTCWQGSIDLNNCRMKIGRQGEIWAGFSTTENIAKATENLYGLVKPDNSTITISNGVISANSSGGTWGSITGTLSDQTDLQEALDDKQDTLTSANAGDNVTIKSILPSAYQRVEYIQSDNTQCIDTGITLNNSYFKMTYDFARVSTASTDGIGGIRTSDSIFGLYTYLVTTLNTACAWGTRNVFINQEGILGNTERHTYVIDVTNSAPEFYVDGTNIYTGLSSTLPTTLNYFIFACNSDGAYDPTRKAAIKLYNWKYEDSTGVVCNLIPCYRKSDNKPGMYDTVSGTFFTNANTSATTDFTVGPDISSVTINALSGLTATVSELNVLDGITATTTELNYSDGVTSNIQTQLDGKQDSLTSANAGDNVTIVEGQGGHDLPAEYQEVEGLSHPGAVTNSQYNIDLMKFADCNKIEITFKSTDVNGNDIFIGSSYATSGYWLIASSGTQLNLDGTGVINPTTVPATITSAIKGNGVKQTWSFTYDNSICTKTTVFNLGGYMNANFTKAKTVYEIKCYLDDTVVADYISCYRKSDNKTGMYDITNNVFHANTGSEEFTVGPDLELVTKINALTGLTATVSELNVLDGITATTTELNYTDGVTSNIQTQLNNKSQVVWRTY